jgi:murein DD-endopeptidase MepM/ murein hydrolase activator NlpD
VLRCHDRGAGQALSSVARHPPIAGARGSARRLQALAGRLRGVRAGGAMSNKRALLGSSLAGLLLCWLVSAGAAEVGQIDTRDAPKLAFPVKCELGVDCFIQNFVDRDPGSGWRDYACGSLSYDGHLGTDIRVPSLFEMERGVEVLAAAPGVVAAMRDMEPDVSVRVRGRESLRGRDAGNGVRITHADGWETQYSHMKRGSVRVRAGQKVEAGDVLGLIGLSGNTEFPHLDFVVRHRVRAIDPFAPQPGNDGECPDGPTAQTLWRPDIVSSLRYRPSGVLIAGFADEKPERDEAQRGAYRGGVEASAASLVFWIEAYGLRGGDVERIELKAPSGEVIARREQVVPNDYAVRFSYIGRRRGDALWASGAYDASYTLEREGEAVVRRQERIEIR